MNRTINYIIASFLLGFVFPSHANCIKITSNTYLSSEIIAAGYTASSWIGANHATGGNLGLPPVISLGSNDLIMPAGTLLASSIADFLTATSKVAYTPNQLLFRCALADRGSLSEIYSAQSYFPQTGEHETSDIEAAYHTSVKNIAIRLTNMKTGEYYSSSWKSRSFTPDDWVEDANYIYIPAKSFSNTLVEIFKTNSTVYNSFYSGAIHTHADPYASGFIAFRGPGLLTAVIQDGDWEKTHIQGWFDQWPGQITLYNNVTYVRGATCMVNDYPSVVSLPPITVPSLNRGESSQNTFSISLSCDDSAVSGVGTTSASTAVAMGFLVNQSTAVTSAKNLGLTTSSGGITHLLDNNYGTNGVASGVGIRIYDESGRALNLLSSRTTRTQNAGGWYAYKDVTVSQDNSTDGVTTYTGNFTASLEAINGESVTAGSVNSQLQVVVSFQ